MKSIKKAFELVEKLLGPQDVVIGDEYRPISFCALVKRDEYMAAYNTLTGELLLLDEKEYSILNSDNIVADGETAELIKKYFLVPVSHDDMQLRNEMLDFCKLLAPNDGKYDGYTVFTTTDCNARCFYCFEHGHKHLHMSDKIAEDTADYILRTCKDKITLGWFGGEPLYNHGVIDIISSRLRASGIEYRSYMVSNAYLFDDECITKAAKDWNLKKVQITLDGTEEVYNRIKAYIYRDGRSPFKIVISNIEKLLKAGIAVDVRLNMDNNNFEDLCSLVEFIGERIGAGKGLHAYSVLLYELPDKPNTIRSDIEREELNRKWLELEEKIFKLGLTRVKYLPDTPTTNRCMADSKSNSMILPDGHLGKCEHYIDERFIGDIYTGVTNTEETASFGERVDSSEICRGCKLYPSCISVKECPTSKVSGICNEAIRYNKEQGLYRSIVKTVKKYFDSESK
ncbi:MAG: 4Fe-4S cluster-binding domain-containing protein [Clostridia bacterium]|nr:4Fe-4S cluster-binding domain-containing protein [Clostridia bacterium]